MPVKLGAKLPDDNAEARIEIIPLIDIMFFLLAAFMLVSLSMVNLKGVKVNLPTATSSTSEPKKDYVDISVDKSGAAFLDKKPMADNEMVRALIDLAKANPNLRVIISGDQDARHGSIIHVLDLVRKAGIDKVAFEIQPPAKAQPR
ncbi:MAG TPA: biopolymer transporter ExbD [Tepidisphaeraceae bacterium]|jgi:biopolymer transport protein ExbD|nr:biopolymer transporter ExbD [Tepidisphaeraceae bacterium]